MFICRSEQTKPLFATGNSKSDPYPHSYRRHGAYPRRCRNRKSRAITAHRIVEQMNRELIKATTPKNTADFDILAGQEQLSCRYPLLVGQRAHRHRIGTCACPFEWTKTSSWKTTASATTTNIPAALRYAYQLPHASQEAITTPLLGTRDFLECRHRRNGTKVWRYRHLPAKRHRSDKRRKRKRLQDIL